MECGKRKAQVVKSDDPLKNMSVPEMRGFIKEKLPNIRGLSRLRRKELCDLIKKKKLMHVFIHASLTNTANSCYIDTFLTALFFFKSSFVNDIILAAPVSHENDRLREMGEDIRQELIRIKTLLQTKKSKQETCSRLRRMFQDFDRVYARTYPKRQIENVDWTSAQNEPLDIVSMLNRIFQIPDTIQTNKGMTMGFGAPSIFTGDAEKLKVKDFIPVTRNYLDDQDRYDELEYTSGNFMYVAINRGYQDGDKSETLVKPVMQIKIKNELKPLKLRAIMIHQGASIHGGHYVALLRKQGKWIYYNDLSSTPYKTVHKSTRELFTSSMMKNSVGLLYA